MMGRTPIPFPPGMFPPEAHCPESLFVREADWFQIRGIAPHEHVWTRSFQWEDRLQNLERCTCSGCGLTRKAKKLDDSKQGK
jgi:hypothetical protein